MAIISREKPEDIRAVSNVNERAFGQKEEAELVDNLRNRAVETLLLVAGEGGRIVGHILFSPVTIEVEKASFEAIALAPMAVLPAYQRKGTGTQLVLSGFDECRRLGHEIVVVQGHPTYYPRFGFVPAKPENIGCEFEVPEEAGMLLEIREGVLAGRIGTVKFQPEFKNAM